MWRSENNLELNAVKTVEIVVDFRKNTASASSIILCDSPVRTVESSCFLGTIITQDLKWELNISSLIKKAQQRMYFLWQLKEFSLPRTMMVHFYTSIIESILTSSITTWYTAATASDRGRLQRVIQSAEKVIGCNLPSLQDLYTSRTLRRAGKIMADPSHPGHKLFRTLPSCRRLRSIKTKTSHHKNSNWAPQQDLTPPPQPHTHTHTHTQTVTDCNPPTPHPPLHVTLTYIYALH
ncbi:uncharacterized protein LOC108902551 isoform X1 [Lates calcarifer]|uniref:Uncharacterized protein LOC108902551 isoform X1 n=1 Tax=Lates calcarifer TaxID=8187 RepID=A0AAJ8DKF0_LATCA|nr:uncharacterized protein LOC108902551 isoform X1 [Lates calcarifer]XP_050922031.1 uncharacterized protein LOC108902551 isoform X1 [Lates calcarifer]